MLLLRLGWRNLWRNPRRSVISLLAVATAFVFLVLMLAMAEGVRDQLLANQVGLLMGHAQLHHPDYLPDRTIYDTLGADEGVDAAFWEDLAARPEIEAASPRVYGFALLSTGEHSSGAQLIGIHPAEEARVTVFLENLPEGQELGEAPTGRILLGVELAAELNASTGGRVAAMTQAADGSLGNALYTVGGVFRTGLTHLDRSLAVLHAADLQELLALSTNQYHEAALRLPDPLGADAVAAGLNRWEGLPVQVEAQSWGELSPVIRDYLSLFEASYAFLIGLVGIFAAAGLLNTMMMAVFERSREIGTVAALGMSPRQILSIFLIESFFLALLGLGCGLLLGAVLMNSLLAEGLDLTRWTGEITLMETRLDPIVRFQWSWVWTAWSALGLALAAVLAAGLPAFRAARMNPVQALADRGEA